MMEFTLCQFDGDSQVRVTLSLDGALLVARYQPDSIEDVSWPAFTDLHRADELWRSTCFELFISKPEASAYLELNISPDGGWNCYAFDSIRTGMMTSNNLEVTEIESGQGQLEAKIHWPDATISSAWSLGLSAVIKTTDLNLEY